MWQKGLNPKIRVDVVPIVESHMNALKATINKAKVDTWTVTRID